MSFSEAHKFSGESIEHFEHIINHVNAGLWEHNTATKKTNWSAGFYAMLGYAPGEIECSYPNFFENILYFEDKKIFLRSTDQALKSTITPAHIRLLTKQNGYQWFESTSEKIETPNGTVIYGMLTNIHQYKIAQLQAAQTENQSADTSRIAKVGGWEIDISGMQLSLSRDVYDIFELTGEVKLKVEEAISFFEPAYRPLVTECVKNAQIYCRPYDIEVLFRTAKNNVIWVRAKGVPVIDAFGKCVTIRGIFQDIDNVKKRGITMQSSINLLDDQNKRLQNFAYIVSHNLRSHAGNLQFMVDLHNDAVLQDEREEIFAHIKTISDSLNSTIGHLDEIVKIQTEIGKERKMVDFETIYNNILAGLSGSIVATDAQIHADFSQAPQLNYIPAYLESILQNLLTNALKYKHPDRAPMVTCRVVKDGEHIYLIVEDNGMGIDLERYGNDVFGMYKTFHLNKDAKGIGLFITRNQVEALGGSISVDSTVNVGTRFTVKLV
ncbi:sensor histidine kinase [Mucilaginibacter glaciei]|uniref:histidine kinase n=1 Tax=Mucilaginibacter glaciei TaxID=2772109 RepID=A0A926NWS1_9SPHI|nr:PAS domain-containing sensor histidine kinase [Mucilaginibacter glaciei]MBD1393253.1 PAS domain-containing sensor histidine kinase [Mucilaginibacter glaciei]